MITYGEIVEYAFSHKTNWSLVNWCPEDLLDHLVESSERNQIVVSTDNLGWINGFSTFKIDALHNVHIITLMASNKQAVKALLRGLKNIVPDYRTITGLRRRKNKLVKYKREQIDRFYGS